MPQNAHCIGSEFFFVSLVPMSGDLKRGFERTDGTENYSWRYKQHDERGEFQCRKAALVDKLFLLQIHWRSEKLTNELSKHAYVIANTDFVLRLCTLMFNCQQVLFTYLETLLICHVAMFYRVHEGTSGVCKFLYNWSNETIGKQHKQCP